MLKSNHSHWLSALLIGCLLIRTALANASFKKADYDYNFWVYESQKNPNLSNIDKRLYEFDNFSSRMPLQNQTLLYENLKVQLKHLLQHLNELCKDACVQQACKAGADAETYVKDWSLFAEVKWAEMPFVPKKETIYNVKNQIEWIRDRLQVILFFTFTIIYHDVIQINFNLVF